MLLEFTAAGLDLAGGEAGFDLLGGQGVEQPAVGLTLLERGDFYMHLADLTAYTQAQQRVSELYANPDAWARTAIINVACSGKFSSDRTIAEYAADVWRAEPCPVK